MNFERRGFLRAGSAGLAGMVFNFESAFAQAKPAGQDVQRQDYSNAPAQGQYPGLAEFKGGSGSLLLHLKLSAGILDVQVENFSRGEDKAFIMDGTIEATNPPADTPKRVRLYRSYFSVYEGTQVFARLGDHRAWTSLLLSRTDDPNVESLTVWHDSSFPESFRIDKNKFQDYPSDKGQYPLDGRASKLVLQGKRKPPRITAEELENALDKLPDYIAFSRGKRLGGKHATSMEFACGFIITAVPGGEMYDPIWNA